MGCAKGILNKPKLSLDLLKLGSETLMAIVIAAVVLNLRDGGPVIEVVDCLAECLIDEGGLWRRLRNQHGMGLVMFALR
jgi:hypothetical protein